MLPAEGVGKGCHGGESSGVGCPVEEESGWPIQLKATDQEVWIGLRTRYPQDLARRPSLRGTGLCVHRTGTKSAIGVARCNGTGGAPSWRACTAIGPALSSSPDASPRGGFKLGDAPRDRPVVGCCQARSSIPRATPLRQRATWRNTRFLCMDTHDCLLDEIDFEMPFERRGLGLVGFDPPTLYNPAANSLVDAPRHYPRRL